jgi:hypothetical protein
MRTRLLVFLLAATALACTGGNDASIRLRAVCFPPTPDATGCPFPSAKCASDLVGTPWVDLAATAGTFSLPIEWDNNLPDNSDPTSGRLNTNWARVEKYKISYSGTGGSLPDFETAVIGAAVTTGGSRVDEVEIIPAAVGTLLLAAPGQIVAEVRAEGRLTDGSTFETAPLRIPVNVMAAAPSTAYSGALACTAPALPAACPQFGQTSASACVTP